MWAAAPLLTVDLAAVSLSSIRPSVSVRLLALMPVVPRTSFLMSWSAIPHRTTCLTISSAYEMKGAVHYGPTSGHLQKINFVF